MAAGPRPHSRRSLPVNTRLSLLTLARNSATSADRDGSSMSNGGSARALFLCFRGFAILLVLLFVAAPALSQGIADVENGNPGAVFRRFLESPPWIKRIVYGMSGDQFIVKVGRGSKGRPHSGVAWFEAALQPSTCYLKPLSNSVFGADNLSGSGSIMGRAGDLHWALRADRAELVISRSDEDSSYFPETVERSMDDVRYILKLGIMHLQPGTLRWTSAESFEADSAGGRGKIHGSITEKEGERPTRLEYTVERVEGYKFVVRYAYLPNRPFPPSEITLVCAAKDKETTWGTNFIAELEVGEFDASFAGFRPTYFAPELTNTFRTLRFISNGILYSIKPDGRIVSLGKGVVPDFSTLEGGPRPRTRAAFYAVAILICFAACSFLWWRKRRVALSL